MIVHYETALTTLCVLGIPQLMYGIAAIFLIRYTEQVVVEGWPKPVPIYFLYKEDKGSKY